MQAEPEGGNLKIAFSQFAFLHCSHPLYKSYAWINLPMRPSSVPK